MDKKEIEKFSVPGAIIVGAIIIAFAVIFALGGPKSTSENQPQVAQEKRPTGSLDSVNEVTEYDHIRGSKDAPVKIVEYSDFECPFCKRFHEETMQKVMEEYGDTGQVAWVYRQWPIDGLHPVKARLEAVTSECVAEIGGNDAFWEFADKFFAVTPSNNRTDVDKVLPQIISELGLSQEDIDACIASGKYDEKIQEDIDNAIATGGRGTPWSIVIAGDKKLPLNGAQPYEAVSQIIDILLEEVE